MKAKPRAGETAPLQHYIYNSQSYIIRTRLANQMKMQDTEQNRDCNEKKNCSQGVRAYEQ